MAKVTWDELARQNQRDILAYGTQIWGRNTARKMRLHIKAEVKRLAQSPSSAKWNPCWQGAAFSSEASSFTNTTS